MFGKGIIDRCSQKQGVEIVTSKFQGTSSDCDGFVRFVKCEVYSCLYNKKLVTVRCGVCNVFKVSVNFRAVILENVKVCVLNPRTQQHV